MQNTQNNQNNIPSQNNILSGLKPVLEMLRDEPEKISKLYCRKKPPLRDARLIVSLCEQNGLVPEFVENDVLDKLCRVQTGFSHQGIVAMFENENIQPFEYLLDNINTAPLPLMLALDQINDPGNLGALARTAYALGCAGIILPRHNSAAPGQGSLRSSAGAIRKIPCAIVTNLARSLDLAEEKGFAIYGSSCNPNSETRALNAFETVWQSPAIIVLGNEHKGIRPGVLKRCGMLLTIPFARKFDSLNIAQAGAIFTGLFASWHAKEQKY